MDLLKTRGITTVFMHLTRGSEDVEETEMSFSSIVDTWLILKDLRTKGTLKRGIYVFKISRYEPLQRHP